MRPWRAIYSLFINAGRFFLHTFADVGPCCRFTPTCSQYASQAFQQHGFFSGLKLTLGRLLRCHPLGSHGEDPVPLVMK